MCCRSSTTETRISHAGYVRDEEDAVTSATHAVFVCNSTLVFEELSRDVLLSGEAPTSRRIYLFSRCSTDLCLLMRTSLVSHDPEFLSSSHGGFGPVLLPLNRLRTDTSGVRARMLTNSEKWFDSGPASKSPVLSRNDD